jgi:DNA-binding CsgD family transcriptional regulator/tetratricopeptide (TPR) repeat protein
MRRMSMLGDVAELVERDRERGLLEAAFDEAMTGRGRVALVTAEAGGGKTALIDSFCTACTGQARFLRGACDALYTPRPLGPIHDFAANLGAELKQTLRGEAVPYQVAAALIDDLHRTGPTVLVVEDVHWVDEATLDVLRLVVPRIVGERALIVLSYRDDSLDAGHPLRVMLGEVASGLALTRVPLAPLSLDAVAQLAEPYGIDAGELYRVTAGNPFFVTEVCASGNRPISATVRDSVLARAARLSTEARALLDAAAIVPQQVELWLLEMLATEHLAELEECLSSGMLVEAAAGSVAFRHELSRLAIEESIRTRRRLSLHRAALAALTESPEGSVDPARLAHHADAAGDAEAVLRFAPAAAEQAAALGAHREAAAQYARAVRYGDRLNSGERGDLLRKQAAACLLTDQYDESLAAATQAIEEYRQIGDRLREGDTRRIRSEAGWAAGNVGEYTQDAMEAISLLETVPASRELARAYARLGALQNEVEKRPEAKAWATRAIELGQQLGAHDLVIRATTHIGTAELFDGAPGGLARMEHLLASAGEAGLVDELGLVYLHTLWPAMTVRNYTITEKHLARGLEYCGEHGLELYRWFLRAYGARIALDTGRWDDAADGAHSVLRMPRRTTMIRILALVVLALVRARRGDPEVRPLLDEAQALGEQSGELPRIGPVAVAKAEIAWLLGRPDEIIEATDAALELAVSRQSTWRVGELLSWRRRADVRDEVTVQLSEPFAAQIAGDWREAARQWRQIGCPYEAALALADSDEEEPLRQALAELRRLEAAPAAAITSRRLRALGVRDILRGPRRSTRTNAAGLTAREIEILALLAEGLRNAEIAQRLFVSPRTVEHHVSAILRKLEAGSRGEAVAKAATLGLTSNQGLPVDGLATPGTTSRGGADSLKSRSATRSDSNRRDA